MELHPEYFALLAVLVAAGAFVVGAHLTRIPYPILLVVGGAVLGFVPGIPDVQLDPELVLIAILPPLLYSAAFFSSIRDLRANARPIGLLSVGLVLVTTVGVAVVARYAVGLGWSEAFVLGAIVSPTDPVAATALAERLGAPRRVATIVEGESLINDGTGLVAYKFAVAAVVTGSFSLLEASGAFVLSVVGGVALGLVMGWLVGQVRLLVEDPPTEMVISLLVAYTAYLPAEALGVSAVVAAVTIGIYMGWNAPRFTTPQTRLQLYGMWELLQFLLNGLLFTLVGLQLPEILADLDGYSAGELALYGAVVAGSVMLIRILWVFPLTYGPRKLSRRVRERDPAPPAGNIALVAWSGMRGSVSLAAALALPLTTDAGVPFPDRELIVFLVYVVILSTLLIQGLTFPLLVRAVGAEDDGRELREEEKARLLAARAAIARIDELTQEEDWVNADTADRMRGLYRYRERRFEARFTDGDGDGVEERSTAYQRMRRLILQAEREELLRLRGEGRINEIVLRRIERDLDLEDARLEI